MLKLIAAAIMLIDHIGLVFFPQYIMLRIIGRLAMPVFAYSIALGFTKTKSYKKYLFRVGIFAIISQIPFWLMIYSANSRYFNWLHLNIGFTFFGALVALYLYKQIKDNSSGRPALQKAGLVIIILTASFMNCDYGGYGILVVLVFYEYWIRRKNIKKTALGLISATLYLALMSFPGSLSEALGLIIMQSITVGALPLIKYYQKTHFKKLKYFFYMFYPVHMVLLALIKLLIFN